jgi:DNA-binding NtrC family response regulator
MKSPGVLFISPYVEDAEKLSKILSGMPLPLLHVRGIEQARDTLTKQPFDVILTEGALADGGWRDVLQLARQVSPDAEVIVTDPGADGHFWAEALNLGAYDLVAQPFYPAEVQRILGNACSRMTRPASIAASSSIPANN